MNSDEDECCRPVTGGEKILRKVNFLGSLMPKKLLLLLNFWFLKLFIPFKDSTLRSFKDLSNCSNNALALLPKTVFFYLIRRNQCPRFRPHLQFFSHFRYGPHFETGNVTNITVQVGNTFYLHCKISLLQDKTVSCSLSSGTFLPSLIHQSI